MADKKPEPSPEDGHTIAYKLFFYFFILLVIGGLLTKIGFDRYIDNLNSNSGLNSYESGSSEGLGSRLGKLFGFGNKDSNSDSDSNKSFSIFSLFPSGDISLGKRVVAKKDLAVRNEPGGEILGFQKRGEVGKVLQGPVSAFNLDWWWIDFKKAPDGWVIGDEVTTSVGLFSFFNFFPWFFGALYRILILVTILIIILIIIVKYKIAALGKIKEKKKDLEKEKIASESGEALPISNLPVVEKPEVEDVSVRRWKHIKSLINSHNINDWKQAIIEADIILDEMLDKMGYHGESVGEKLKQIEPSDFLTLDKAWEAHKVRNQIAHRGGNYIISKEEAENVIKLYEDVFREFYFI